MTEKTPATQGPMSEMPIWSSPTADQISQGPMTESPRLRGPMSEISLPGVGQKSDPSGVVKSAHTHLTAVRVSAGPGADHSRSPDLDHLCDLDPAAPLTDRRRFVKGSLVCVLSTSEGHFSKRDRFE